MGDKLTTNQFAEKFDFSPFRVRQLIRAGTLPAEKFGRDYMIDSKYIEVIKNLPETRGRKVGTVIKKKAA